MRSRHAWALAVFLSGCGIATAVEIAHAPREYRWDFDKPGAVPDCWGGLTARQSLPHEERDPDGASVLVLRPSHSRAELQWHSLLTFPADVTGAELASAVEISSWIKGPADAQALVRVTGPRGDHFTGTQSLALNGGWQRLAVRLPLVRPLHGGWMLLPRLIFENNPAAPILLGPVLVRLHFDAPAPIPPHLAVPAADLPAGWRPLATGALHVVPGSALDFSPFSDRSPAGTHGRATVNERGELVFASRPDEPIRFLSLQWIPPRYEFSHLTDAQLADYADAIVRQGYNLVRFHFLDDYLSGNTRAPALKRSTQPVLLDRPEDIAWDPRALDRVHRFLFELKRRGVYWNVDLMTSFVGFANGAAQHAGIVTGDGFNTKVQLYVNPAYRANWRAGVTRLLDDLNPYTGMALKDDPALALVSCLNEQEILIPHRDYGKSLDPAWHVYLKNRYGTYAALHSAWRGRCGEAEIPAPADVAAREGEGAFDSVPSIDARALADTPAGRDMARACGEIEAEMSAFYLKTLREAGFDGLVSNWNMRTRIGTVPARALFPAITMNSYHAHPHLGERTTIDPRSSLASGGASFKNQAVARFLDRPFVNTEFGHVFWNSFRHEQGLLHGAGAALQGWSGLTAHTGQVVASGAPLSPFNVGDDPVLRASELVAAFLFRRGDVAPSPHRVEIPLSDEFIYGGGRALHALDDELSRLWMLCRVGIAYGERRAASGPHLVVSPEKTVSIGGDQMSSTVDGAALENGGRLVSTARRLRELGVLGPENRTDPGAGLLQSDTGELTIDTSAGGEFFVRTPRFEGAVLKADRALRLGALSIERCTQPASVSLVSIDPRPAATLRTASRLLLVLATDARNHRMRLEGEREDVLLDNGTLPVLVRTASLEVRLARPGLSASAPERVRAFALHLNGERGEELPVVVGSEEISLIVDTGRLSKTGPTPFFEIVIGSP